MKNGILFIYFNFREIFKMCGYLVVKFIIDQKQEIGRREMSCYSQSYWQQYEVIVDRVIVRKDLRDFKNQEQNFKLYNVWFV